ncbi:putative membrane protein [Nostoc flagelliforme CCNUN1]|uniref:Putative membrane protein n=1 Tax=Nostoc flagelliforme CCNUN1 TaxID=2038116 RepID=A0A2K8T3L5_9NOSO|nr:putative membrane protein [Nostoc flagelliforme CCNUN1]
MRQLVIAERVSLIGHLVSTVFGLVGILLVVPNAQVIFNLSKVGQTAMQWSMAGGGVVYMILGAAGVFLYATRILGLGRALAFLLPSVFISLGSELLGTSTGFPFGHYSYLSGLGYKIAGLVPFTIPLSWFYLGFVSYLLARAGLEVDKKPNLWRHISAIALGALLGVNLASLLPGASSTKAEFVV